MRREIRLLDDSSLLRYQRAHAQGDLSIDRGRLNEFTAELFHVIQTVEHFMMALVVVEFRCVLERESKVDYRDMFLLTYEVMVCSIRWFTRHVRNNHGYVTRQTQD